MSNSNDQPEESSPTQFNGQRDSGPVSLEFTDSELFRNDTVFVLSSASVVKPVGTAPGEMCPVADIKNNAYFALNDNHPHWRRMLSNSYMRTMFTNSAKPSQKQTRVLRLFDLDHRGWASVEHCLQYSRLEPIDPEYASRFSMGDTKSHALSRAEASVAKKAGLKAILSDEQVRDWEDRRPQCTLRCQWAKYSQNEDLAQVLLATGDAKLVTIEGKSRVERVERELMIVRKMLREGRDGRAILGSTTEEEVTFDSILHNIDDDEEDQSFSVSYMIPKYSKPKTSTNGMSVSLPPTPVSSAPVPSSGVKKDTEGAAQPDESRSQPLKPMNVTDAMAYIQSIREHRDPSVYDEFLKIMTEFKSQRINTPQVLERVATLFKGQPSMIRQFMQFLPPGHVLQSADVEKSDAQPIYVLTPAGSRIVIDPSTGRIQT
ncbi:hypothetical protein K450DRAFT_231652 [Umbelopsis ramanniana AG]|uniref:NADAR domain-containing protein n=1 Tax=Umbelopsis ramanniana AG TaxID=1314678 RepID=A0AAD5HGU8_UMBRA|nr:uncharacterized protein K450DRAFT_231652 [Umbelopsis ramanniana AG]KAI8581508.1 hypothetical protein K450DRAFT_231652 [Umbelopsis ramanniana AG]